MKFFKSFKSLLAIIIVVLLLSALLSLSKCAKFSKKIKHYKSSTIGLKRKVVLYACDGTPIQTWEGRFMVELQGNAASWINNGKEVKISGTFIIGEL